MILASNNIAVLYEAILKSAPQFIIGLYAMVAQKESVKVVHTVSLPVSFLCLVWASTVADDVIHGKEEDGTVNYMAHETNKLVLFLTHFFVLSSRLIAIALFTVSFKWWITTVLIFHSIAIVICDVSLFYPKGESNLTFASLSAFSFCFHWLRDDLSMRIDNGSSAEKKKRELRKMQMFSNAFFVTENIIMILLFYFSQFPHTWYALPVTVCVSSFALLEATMRVTHFCFLRKESNTVETPASYQPIRQELEEAPGRGNFWVRCAAGSLEPLTFTRASSAEFCYPILE